ncbi:hydrogenase nickel incorporation protein HypB, partial [Klebsiella pneumoniae]
ISSLNGQGLDEWCDWLMKKVEQKKGIEVLEN